MSQVDTNPNRTLDEAYREFGVERILRDNSATPFVRDILFPFKNPEMQRPREPMAQKLEYMNTENGSIVYPRLMLDETGQLRDYGQTAFDEALRRRNIVRFETPEMAEKFAQLYPRYWSQIGFNPNEMQEEQRPEGMSPAAMYLMQHSGR